MNYYVRYITDEGRKGSTGFSGNDRSVAEAYAKASNEADKLGRHYTIIALENPVANTWGVIQEREWALMSDISRSIVIEQALRLHMPKPLLFS